jgi:hypothetical protein
MGVTKTRTSLLWGLIAVFAVAWQAHMQRQLIRNKREVDTQLVSAGQISDQLEEDLHKTHDRLLRAKADREKSEHELVRQHERNANHGVRPAYHWDDASPMVRVPKSMLDRSSIGAAVNRRGRLTDQIKEILQLSDLEAQQSQAALDRFLESYYSIQSQNMRPVVPREEELGRHTLEETRVFEISDMGESFTQLRDNLLTELEVTLGSDRLALLRETLQGWMSIGDNGAMSLSMAVLAFGRRERFYEPAPGARTIGWGFVKLDHSGAVETSMPLADIPVIYKPFLNDWIQLARSQPAVPAEAPAITAP